MLSKSKELANLAALWPFLSPFGYGEVVCMGARRMDGWSDGQFTHLTDEQTNFWTPHRITLSLSIFLGLSNQVTQN